MAKHRTHSIEFKRQVVQDYLGGETLYGLAKRHEISRTLIRVWLAKHEAGVLDSDTAAADMLADYEARIAALERLVGKLALVQARAAPRLYQAATSRRPSHPRGCIWSALSIP
jgi:transposase